MKVPKPVVVAALLLVALGTPGRAFAQIDLSGVWAPIFHEDQPERVPGPDVGDYAGLPINDAARLKADTWDASLLTLPEHQCKPHPSTYGFRGVGNLRITPDFDDATQRLVKDEWVYYAPFLTAVGQPFVQPVGATGSQPKSGWQAQLILTLPLYDGGLRGSIARERDALVTETRADLEEALRQAQSEVRTAFEAMVRADRGLGAARDAARLAERALELANVAYKAGATTNLEVIDAAHAALGAETAAAQAEDAARQARLDVLVSSGRFP